MKREMFPAILVLLVVTTLVSSQENAVERDYLGQAQPGATPALFANGIVSTNDFEHSSPAISSSLDQIFWSVRVDGEYGKEIIRTVSKKGNKWSATRIPSFSLEGMGDLYPTFSSSGNEILFTSDRPDPANPNRVVRYIWKTIRKGDDWSNPEIVGFEGLDIYGLSIARNGSLYFMAQPVDARETSAYDIYYSRFRNGKYATPVKLGEPISTESYEDGPFISSDEKFLIFESTRPGGYGKLDLYISKRLKKGGWSTPKNLGKVINSDSSERFPYLSPDGKYFFFGSNRTGNFDTYWIGSSVIYDLIK